MNSTHKIGDTAYFQPVLTKIDGTGIADDSAVPCKVVGVSFTRVKILYDLALQDEGGEFYESFPLCRVDSFFVLSAPKE